MGLFWSKKKFGLAQALIVIGAKPDVTPEGFKTGAAFVEALGIPVVVFEEAGEKITELKDSVKEMEEGIKAVKTELDAAPGLATKAINVLKEELKKLVDAIRGKVLGKVDHIEDVRDRRIAELEVEIEAMKEGAKVKGNKARTRGEKKTSKIEEKINAKIIEIETEMEDTLVGLENQISNLESEMESAKTEIDTLAKIRILSS